MNPAHRNLTIDFLRGLVMILMTIDHVREYAAGPGTVADPVDLTNVSPLLFLMRWVTHFCAPVFALLMGVSAGLSGATPRRLLKRGAILLLLEATLCNWAWTFNPVWPRYFFQVIGALGVSLWFLATVRNPHYALALGMALACIHNAFDAVSFPPHSLAHYLWSFLHQKNVLPLGFGGFEVRTTYPVIPVVALTLCGYGIAEWFRSPVLHSKRIRITGLALCGAFLFLRLTNTYGDSNPFTPESTLLYTLFSLGNVTKYPMSLQFLLMTAGPALLFLSTSWRGPEWIRQLGRTPLFFYIAHLMGAHLLAWVGALAAGYPLSSFDVTRRFGGMPLGFGFPLWATLPLCALLIALLWPVCRWHDRRTRQTRAELSPKTPSPPAADLPLPTPPPA